MGGIIAAVVLIVVAIGFSAWWKGRLIGQGKIIQRHLFIYSSFIEDLGYILNFKHVPFLPSLQRAS